VYPSSLLARSSRRLWLASMYVFSHLFLFLSSPFYASYCPPLKGVPLPVLSSFLSVLSFLSLPSKNSFSLITKIQATNQLSAAPPQCRRRGKGNRSVHSRKHHSQETHHANRTRQTGHTVKDLRASHFHPYRVRSLSFFSFFLLLNSCTVDYTHLSQ
jgi:hypothetical protein